MIDPNCKVCSPGACIHGEQSDHDLIEEDERQDRRVAAAVEKEREACVQITDRWRGHPAAAFLIARDIRARGGK